MSQKEKKILKGLLYLLGFFSLFLLPSFGKLNMSHLSLILLGLFLGFLYFRYFHIRDFYFFYQNQRWIFILAAIYFFATIFGSWYHKNFIGILTSFVFLAIFSVTSLLAFFANKFQENFYRFFWLGFYTSVMASSFLIFMDFLLYLFTQKVFVEFLPLPLTFSAGTHPLKNLDNPLSKYIPSWPALRASAFSWDPGLNGPALILGFVLSWEKIINFPLRRFGLFFILIAIFVSFSKTSLAGLLGYIFFKVLLKTIPQKKVSLREKLFHIAPLGVFLGLFGIGFFFSYEITEEGFFNTSVLRHLKYLSSIVYLFNTSFWEIVFGFGYRHTGYFLLHYVPWFQIDLGFDPVQDMESFLTNVFLWGGLLGSIYWIYSFVKTYQNATEAIRLIFITILFLTFGYNFHAVWFLFFYHSLYWYTKLTKTSSIGI